MRRRRYVGDAKRVCVASSAEIESVLSADPKYHGNPQHKRFPDDYNLTPPACARLDKTLCDQDPRDPERIRRVPKLKAVRIFSEGLRKGLYSGNRMCGLPKRIWAVDEDGVVYEAKLDESGQGRYHGYPLASEQRTLIEQVLALW